MHRDFLTGVTPMATISYAQARNDLAWVWDRIEDSRQAVILRRRGDEDMAMLAARDLRSLHESVHPP